MRLVLSFWPCSCLTLCLMVLPPSETEAGSAGTQPDQGITRPMVCRKAILAPGLVTLAPGLLPPLSDTEVMPWKIQPASHGRQTLLHGDLAVAVAASAAPGSTVRPCLAF